MTQRDASERLGFHRDYLNQVLRESVEPKVEHLLMVLELLGETPDLFFEEHYGARPPEQPERRAAMQRTKTVPTVLTTALLASWATAPALAGSGTATVAEVYTQSFYDGIEVTVEAHTDDTFTAFVTVAEDGAHPVRAW